jgi:hypothetical protein
VSGVATFPDLSISKSGAGYTLGASAGTLTGATSGAFTITAGAAAQLVFTVQPSSAVAGHTLSPAVAVTAQDALGNVVTGFTGSVTVAIGTNPSGGTLSGTLTVAAVNGSATFTNLSLDKAGTGYTLAATSGTLTGPPSAPFTITAAPVSGTVSTVVAAPTAITASSGTSAATLTVTAKDAFGNPISGAAVVLTATGTGNTLTQPVGVTDGNGVATGSLSSILAGLKTVTAAISGVTVTQTASVTVNPGAVSALGFTAQPTNTVAGAVISPAVAVSARDAFGNTVPSFTGSVTIAIGANPAGGTLTGTLTMAAASGVATFSTLSIDKSGTAYTLAASSGTLTPGTSAAFNITAGTVTQLVFTAQPTSAVAGRTISPPVAVTTTDALGNTVTSFAGAVALALASGPSGATLSGTSAVAAVNGVATFTNLSINQSGTGYTLVPSAGTLTGPASAVFAISAASVSATQSALVAVPSSIAASTGTSLATLTVTARDAFGNPISGAAVNLACCSDGGKTGNALTQPGAPTDANGVTTGSLSSSAAGLKTVTASISGVTVQQTAAVTVTPGPVAAIVFTGQPSTTAAGAPIAPAVTVSARDALGNTVTSFTGNVTVAIGTNLVSGTLSGTLTVAAVGGVATFSDLSITKPSTGYTLTATTTGLPTITSASFAIVAGAPSQLVFGVQPTSTSAGVAIAPAVTVRALDALGNPVTAFAGNVTVAIGTNPSAGVLAGSVLIAAVSGVATFSTLSIDRAGVGYTLVASSGTLTQATSAAFNVAGPATHLVWTVQPSTTQAGSNIKPPMQVTAQDALGTVTTAFTGSVSLVFGANPGAGPLVGTTAVSAVRGVATFTGVSVDVIGTGYTLVASAAGLTSATSAPFDILLGPATRLDWSVQPVAAAGNSIVAGRPIGQPYFACYAEDGGGNRVPTFTDAVTAAFSANPTGTTLVGTTTVSAVSGLATFNNVTINTVGTGYTLVCTTPTLKTTPISRSFNIIPSTPNRLLFLAQPSNAVAGSPITPAVQVIVQDSLGNRATQFTGNVTLAIGTNPAGGTLSGTVTVAAVSGVATFANLSINKAGIGYTLVATSGTLTAATSTAFNIN